MLAALLLAGLVAAPLTSAALFATAARPRRVRGALPAARRLTLALGGTAVVAVAVDLVLRLLEIPLTQVRPAVVATVVASLLWVPFTRRWNARAHLAWASSVLLFAAYLAFVLAWTLASGLSLWGVAARPAAVAVRAGRRGDGDGVPVGALRRARHRELAPPGHRGPHRRLAGPTWPPISPECPLVSLHVPAHNEPPDMVIETLESLRRINYPRYEIVVIDDNTDDEALWRPVEAWCADARGAVRAPGRLARIQVRARSTSRCAEAMDPGTPRSSEWSTRTTRSTPASCAAACPCSPTSGSASSRRRRTTATGTRRAVPAPALLLLQVLLRGVAALAQRTRRRDLRRHHGPDPAGRAGARSAAGTSGASPRMPSCRCGCCGRAGPDCTWTRRWAAG